MEEDISQVNFVVQKVRTSRYVYEYKNVWDPVNKRSKPLYRIPVGKVIGDKIVLNDEYLQKRPNLKQGDIVLAGTKAVLASRLTQSIQDLFEFKEFLGNIVWVEDVDHFAMFYRKLGAEIKAAEDGLDIKLCGMRLRVMQRTSGPQPFEDSKPCSFYFDIATESNILALSSQLHAKGLHNELIEILIPGGEAVRAVLLKDPANNQIILKKQNYVR